MLGDGAGAADTRRLAACSQSGGWAGFRQESTLGSCFADTNSYIYLALSLYAVCPQTGKTEEFP